MRADNLTIKIKSDKPLIVLSVDEYESMKETIELLTHYPDLLKELKEERKQINKGKFITLNSYKAKYKKR
ncbi:MAG TPA: hypothetical protein ENI34_09025 [candidate division WOR-3 bacterium]|uniref:Antitoxin n=1 Tax=candidate division WOR-3 bacterium TaxID=2052148 RepID=A0A9C9ENV5_UNCW3|nr:hypothetical protein [candidate division WOR-3 bacterium]